MSNDYLTAEQAASTLGVSVATLYSYVSRKGLRSQPVPGTRKRRYWKGDIDRLSGQEIIPPHHSELRRESEITLITGDALFYRGRNAVELATNASFETVASLLWQCDEAQAFTSSPPKTSKLHARLDRLLAEADEVDRSSALFPTLEAANPRAYDLSPEGMARTGADVLRSLAAITTRTHPPRAAPLHEFVAETLGLPKPVANIVRCLLVLAADHGFEAGALAVRAAAAAGVTPWRSVLCGLSVTLGPRSRLGAFDAATRMLREIAESRDAVAPVMRRIKDGEKLPGFGSPLYSAGDPRAAALFERCNDVYADDAGLRALQRVFAAVREICGLQPNFALACLYVGGKVGLRPGDSLFHLGRTAGWIAHAIEQYQQGEAGHYTGVYKGNLPMAP